MAENVGQLGGAPKKRAKDFAEVRDWPGYFEVMVGTPARETLLKALEGFEEDERKADGGESPAGRQWYAVDLACGEGRDTLELLRRGWRVLAIDGHPKAFEHLLPRVSEDERGRLETRLCDFRTVQLPACDLVNCSFSLPFCEPEDFPALWGKIVEAIRPGGRFAGQFFGDRDDWAKLPDRTHHTRSEVEGLLAGFNVEMLAEDEKREDSSVANPKHWHVFHVVARKR